MKALFIGGTGTISSAVSTALIKQGCELYLLNRGNNNDRIPEGANILKADINDEANVSELIKDHSFDVVADFIAFVPSQIERDIRLFAGKTKQYIFISSASAYQKPLSNYIINESTPLANPYWEYSRNKIACEELLISEYRNNGYPITIVRPSHTYDNRSIPLGVHGRTGSWQVVKRMLAHKPVIIHGDGSSLWTLTHNSDFAKGFIGLMGNIHAIGEAVNITSDESITWNQIYRIIASALKVELNAVHIATDYLAACSNYDFTGSLIGDKANSVVFDNSKVKRLVPDFIPTVRFDQGVRLALENIMLHPELQKDDTEFDIWCDKVIENYNASLNQIKCQDLCV
jgi:nucleoside-diphosphate-sugar epimerase